MRSMRQPATGLDLGAIVVAWLLFLAGLQALHAQGYQVGFGVWPMGEDRVWISFLQRGQGGTEIARLFWQVNDRNPVSPWWYIALKPILLGSDNGILWIRYAMSLLLAVAAYLALRGVTGARGSSFALGVGVLVAFLSANGYIDNIYWIFVAALATSLLSVWAYTRFLASERRSLGWYALSLVLWFLAISSYTLQSGAVLAIAYLAFIDPRHGSPSPFAHLSERLRQSVADSWPYLALFAIFFLIWRTTSNPSMSVYYQVSPSLRQLVKSLSFGVWHFDYASFLSWFGGPLGRPAQLVVFLLVAGVVFALLAWRDRIAARFAEASDPDPVIDGRGLFDAVVVCLCLVVPTIAVEASSSVWVPGARWRMVHQLWIPLQLTVLFAIALLFLTSRRTIRSLLWRVGVAAAAATLFMIDIGHNSIQVRATASERNLYLGLRQQLADDLAAGAAFPQTYLVRLDPGTTWISSDALSSTYASTWFPGQDVSMRIIQSAPPRNPDFVHWWRIRFGADDVGVENARVAGLAAAYRGIRIVSFDGRTVRALENVDAATFAGLQVDWARSGPLPRRPGSGSRTCSSEWTAADSVSGTGWGLTEKDQFAAFRWMTAREVSVAVPRCGDRPAELVVEAAFAVTDATLASLEAALDGKPVALERTTTARGPIYVGRVEQAVRSREGPYEVVLKVPKLDTLQGATRQFGVAIRRIEITAARASP
jgi:hypothetical protein